MPDQTASPGRAAYEAYDAAMPHLHCGPWDEIADELRSAMEAAASAAIDFAVHKGTLDAGQVPYEAYCDASGGKSLISGAPLPAWGDQAEEIRNAWNHAAFTAAGVALQDLWAVRAELDEARAGLAALAERWEAIADRDEEAARRPDRPRLVFETRAGTRRQCAAELRKLAGLEAGQ